MSETKSNRRIATLAALAIFVLLATAVGAPIVYAQTDTDGGGNGSNTTTTTPANTTATTAPPQGRPIQSSCANVRDDPTGDGPDYRVVRGACSIRLSSGEVLSNVWFKANGESVEITTSGTGWTIRNVAITNNDNPESALHLRTGSRNGSGLVHNLWASDFERGNVIFVGPRSAGQVVIRQSTFLNIAEDAIYASRSGNPLTLPGNHIDGGGGTVGVEQVYVKNVGVGPESGYGVRLGSDGSYVVDSTIVSTSGPAVANTFAGGYHARQYPGSFDGVLVRNVDIITQNTGIRFNNHQSGIKGARKHTAITYLENVRIDAGTPLERNDAGGTEPVVNGDYSEGARDVPPDGAPRSPERAASGVGGGTGGIGGSVRGGDEGSSWLMYTEIGIWLFAFLVLVGPIFFILWLIFRDGF